MQDGVGPHRNPAFFDRHQPVKGIKILLAISLVTANVFVLWLFRENPLSEAPVKKPAERG
jgi:hypothetical protein